MTTELIRTKRTVEVEDTFDERGEVLEISRKVSTTYTLPVHAVVEDAGGGKSLVKRITVTHVSGRSGLSVEFSGRPLTDNGEVSRRFNYDRTISCSDPGTSSHDLRTEAEDRFIRDESSGLA